MKWFRLYNEIIDDPKIAKMNPKLFKFFIFLMCLASECDKNGDIPFSKEDLSWRIRLPKKDINSYLSKLKELGIITANPVISLKNWEKRQYKSDSSKERVERYRKKKSNVTVTQSVTPPEQNRTETEQNRTEQMKKRVFVQKEFDGFYSSYPNPKSRKEALERWKKLIKSGDLPSLEIILKAIEKQKMWRENAGGEFRPEWKHPATWLNKWCWEDEAEDNTPKKYKQPSLQEMLS